MKAYISYQFRRQSTGKDTLILCDLCVIQKLMKNNSMDITSHQTQVLKEPLPESTV